MCKAGRDTPKKTCSFNCSEKVVLQSIDLGGLNTNSRHTFHIFICKNNWKPFIIFLPLHNYVPLCVGLSHKIPIKYIYVFRCNMRKCGKFQGVWILFQGTVFSHCFNMFLSVRWQVCLGVLNLWLCCIFYPQVKQQIGACLGYKYLGSMHWVLFSASLL